jgi:parallel beta-helix repeat protein
MKVSSSGVLKNKLYKIDGDKESLHPVILVEGSNIVLDFKNAVLKGSDDKKNPDEFFGLGILIRNSKKVTIRNLKIRGYKIGLLAKNVDELTLENCDLSYNYRQHLNSTQEKEDLSDWLSHHHNENDEWLRYGAGIYLRDCNKPIIKNCRVTGGQNALMMTQCNDALIYNNDFSFNSGIGIGLYRSSRNKIMYNRIIFNVRGYSDGVYNRGQDSAGLLVYEQSDDNFFYKNNVTHCGDGLFLWAGQTTMDNGKGGCNNNIIMGNDFSYAPTNGVEATFSSNTITDNRIVECDNGVWGGYSFNSTISNNKFRNNKTAIAIEHGQHNRITYNVFNGDKEAIKLWERGRQPADWGYAKSRDTRSHDYVIAYNNFTANGTAIDLHKTDSLNIFNNIYQGYGQLFKIDSSVTNLDTAFNEKIANQISEDTAASIPVISNPSNPFKNVSALAGKKNIRITQWGPYDFRYPIIWNTNPTDTGEWMHFEIKGPEGKWKIKDFSGVDSLSAINGTVPAAITAKKIKGERTDINIGLEYTGASITTPFGETIPKGKSYFFSFNKFFQPIHWNVKWYGLDTNSFNPIKEGRLFPENKGPDTIKTTSVKELDFAWWGGIRADKVYPQFITVAEATEKIPNGDYELSLTWDDAVRVYVDGKLVINEWNPSLYNFDESPNRKFRIHLEGEHHFKVEHLELGGFATLQLKLRKIAE